MKNTHRYLKIILSLLMALVVCMSLVFFSACSSGSNKSSTSSNSTKSSSSSSSSSTSKSSSSGSKSSTLTPQSEPSNGSILDGSESGKARITVNAASNASAYIKVVKSGSTQVGFYVRAGNSASVDVPSGTYSVHFAQGSTWYGKSSRFGDSTSYGQDSSVQLSSGEEVTYTLTRSTGGNFSPSTLSASEF